MLKRIMVISVFGAVVLALLAVGQVPQSGCSTVPFQDKTIGPSPLRLSGSASLCETEKEGGVVYRQEGDLVAQNEAQKAVVSLVIAIQLRYPHSRVASKRFQYDRFFGAPLQPARSERFPIGSGATTEPGSLGVPMPPSASATTLFIEFSDGTTFGDVSSAAELLTSRRQAISVLRSLRAASEASGEDAFALALEQHAQDAQVENLLKLLREVKKSSGPGAALRRVRDILEAAASRPDPLSPGRTY